MWIGVISLFPDMFRAVTDYGIVGRAVRKGLLSIRFWNPREFANDIHRSVDDYLYGGGSGMLMIAQPLKDAISCAKREVSGNVKVIYLSPQGRIFNQDRVNELLMDSKLILVCGRYKGVDERIIMEEIDEEWSIGDYILSGGELAAMVLIDTVSRFIPGVLGRIESAMDDTFSNNKKLAILSPPHYTRPAVFNGISVPNILLSGNHREINKWRLKKSLERTWFRRPELLKNVIFSDEEKQLLLEFKHEILNQLNSELC